MKSFPKDMTDWQAIQDNYNAMKDNSQPLMVAPEDIIQPEPVRQPAQIPPQEIMEEPGIVESQMANVSDEVTTEASAPEMTRAEQLWQEYSKLMGEDRKALAEARNRDRMLKLGAAAGDALATIVNARNQMNVAAPGVQVQQGAGLARIADIAARAPEIQSDLSERRADLLAQYRALAEGDSRDLQRRRIAAYERQVENAGKKAEGQTEAPSFEEKEKTKARIKEQFQVNKENRQLKEKLEPAISTVDEQIKNVKDALNILEKSNVGTGPIDQYIAGVTPQGQLLKKALGNIQLDTLVTKFQGMSRAIDTETDRKFFQETQPSMSNFETTNKKMLSDILKRLESLKTRSEKKLQEVSDVRSFDSEETQRAAPSPKAQAETRATILRRDPKTGRTVEFDAETKKPIRFVD